MIAFIANLVRLACETANASGATFFTVDDTGEYLEPYSIYNLPEAYVQGIGRIRIGTQCCGRAVSEKRPWVVTDMLSDPLFADGVKGALESPIRAAFSVPVTAPNGEIVGSLACHFAEPHEPTHYEIERNLVFATLIGHALHSPKLQNRPSRETKLTSGAA